MMKNNGGIAAQVVASGNDIGTTDQVLGVHFGANQQTFGNTAPTANQCWQFNGTSVIGINCGEMVLSIATPPGVSPTVACVEGGNGACEETVFANAHTLLRLTFNLTQAPVTCGTNAVIAVKDMTSSTILSSITVNQVITQFVDSGALSVATTAGHKILVGTTTAASGCGTVPNVSNVTAVFQ